MRAYEKQAAYIEGLRENDQLWEKAYQLFMSRYKPGMSAWTNQPASLRQSYYDEVKAEEVKDIGYGVVTCPGCSQRVALYVMGVMSEHFDAKGELCGWSHT